MNKKTYNAPKCKLIELEKEILQTGSPQEQYRDRVPAASARGRNSTQTYSLEDGEEEW